MGDKLELYSLIKFVYIYGSCTNVNGVSKFRCERKQLKISHYKKKIRLFIISLNRCFIYLFNNRINVYFVILIYCLTRLKIFLKLSFVVIE